VGSSRRRAGRHESLVELRAVSSPLEKCKTLGVPLPAPSSWLPAAISYASVQKMPGEPRRDRLAAARRRAINVVRPRRRSHGAGRAEIVIEGLINTQLLEPRRVRESHGYVNLQNTTPS